jgi:putative hemolysin
VFVPETLSGMELLEHFRTSGAELVFVVDEYGAVQGVITVRDVLEAITGEFSTPSDEDAWAVRRDDGSWLMDGLIPVPELKDRLESEGIARGRPRALQHPGRHGHAAAGPPAAHGRRGGVGGLASTFEVVDLDGKRVDKVLCRKAATRPRSASTSSGRPSPRTANRCSTTRASPPSCCRTS